MSVRVPRRYILPLSSISESPPAIIDNDSEDNYPFRAYPLTKKNGSKPHTTYSNKDFKFRSLNDRNEESSSDDVFSLEPSIEAFDSYDFDDEHDSAYSSIESESVYSSIESEEGNIPEFHLLLERDRGTPNKLKSLFPHAGDKSTHSTTQTVNTSQCSRAEHSKKTKQKPTATCSRHPESKSSDDDSNNDLIANGGQEVTKSNVPVILQQSQAEISSNSNAVSSDLDLDIGEKKDDGFYEDLLQVISSDSQRDHKEKLTHVTAGADKEDSVDTLYLRHPEYFGLQISLENFDTDIGKAYEASLESKSLSPLIKEELKCLIQCRRLQSGQSEFVVQPEEPKEYKLTEEEIRKKHARLEQNRRSSKKARYRARTNESVMLKYIEDAKAAQANLTKMANQLRQKRDQTVAALKDHLDVCTKLELADTHRKKLKYMSSLF